MKDDYSMPKFNSSVINSAIKKCSAIADYQEFRAFGGTMEAFVRKQGFSEDEYRACFFSKEVVDNSTYFLSWTFRALLTTFIEDHPALLDEIMMHSIIPEARVYLLETGKYNDISIIDKLALDSSVDVRCWVAQHSSFDVLKTMSSDSSAKVRRLVLHRLGPVEALDEMLSDKDAAIREQGARYAPINYNGFSNMCGELSKKVFPWIVLKIRRDKLPMLLGNRNMKNSHCKELLSRRMQ